MSCVGTRKEREMERKRKTDKWGELAGTGDRIKAIRKAKNISLSDISKETGIAKSSLFNIENELQCPSVYSLHKIAKCLGTNILHLVTGGHWLRVEL